MLFEERNHVRGRNEILSLINLSGTLCAQRATALPAVFQELDVFVILYY